jgi:hypothetical protein
MVFYILLGLFIDLVLQSLDRDNLQWLLDLSKISSIILLGCITFLLLALFAYRTFFHLAFLICASVTIAFFLFDIYFRYTFDKEGDSHWISIVTLTLHVLIFNITMKKLSALRDRKGLAPLKFL